MTIGRRERKDSRLSFSNGERREGDRGDGRPLGLLRSPRGNAGTFAYGDPDSRGLALERHNTPLPSSLQIDRSGKPERSSSRQRRSHGAYLGTTSARENHDFAGTFESRVGLSTVRNQATSAWLRASDASGERECACSAARVIPGEPRLRGVTRGRPFGPSPL